MHVNTRYINTTSGTSSKKDAPRWHMYPTFQTYSATQVCTGIRQNQFLFKIGHSPRASFHKRALKLTLIKSTTLTARDNKFLYVLPLKSKLEFNKGIIMHKIVLAMHT